MPNSHHRHKHIHTTKQTAHHVDAKQTKKKAAPVLGVIGAVAGAFVGYFANSDSIVAVVAGLVVGTFAGYLFGKSIDNTSSEK